MKIVFNEKLKHRLVGAAVIFSLIVIFAPMIVKKSQLYKKDLVGSLQIPKKPTMQAIIIPEKEALFKKVKAVQIDLPPPRKIDTARAAIAMEPLSAIKQTPDKQILNHANRSEEKPAMHLVKQPRGVKPMIKEDKTNKKPIAQVSQKPTVPTYAIQVAFLAQEHNAVALVNKLKKKGYSAEFNLIKTKKGDFYKVFVGATQDKHQAEQLQKQLAKTAALNGFIITRGVS